MTRWRCNWRLREIIRWSKANASGWGSGGYFGLRHSWASRCSTWCSSAMCDHAIYGRGALLHQQCLLLRELPPSLLRPPPRHHLLYDLTYAEFVHGQRTRFPNSFGRSYSPRKSSAAAWPSSTKWSRSFMFGLATEHEMGFIALFSENPCVVDQFFYFNDAQRDIFVQAKKVNMRM